ncbi:MAG TPA: ABC transporter permease [Chloroflexota bacterium]|nr:ABC transporter permease [Chloroflexota bacterium]
MTANPELLQTVAEPAAPETLVLPPLNTRGGGGVVLWEVIRISFDSLLANRMRSLLTMLGVIIGVASVVTLLSLGQGATAYIANQIEALGTNLIVVAPGSSRNGPGDPGLAPLTMDDVNAIAALGLPLHGIAPQFSGGAELVAPAADKNASLTGVTASYLAIGNLTVASGSFITEAQVSSADSVIVLGANLATDLFGNGNAVGQRVRVNGYSLRVVGVLAAKGGGSFGSVDDLAYVPITLAQQQLFNGRTPDGNGYQVSFVEMSAINGGDIPAIKQRVSALLRDRHHLKADGSNDDFQIQDQKSLLSSITTITSLMTLFVGAVAGISLVVGGIGIMNILLVSVTERTREIGLRKAVGAQGRDILLQFIVEAVVISVTGGLIGLALGGGLMTAISLSGLFSTPVTLESAMIAVGFSMAVGLFFGIYPAQRAARLNPIEALRYE